MTDRELMRQALRALECHNPDGLQHKQWYAALEALRARLAQPEPEPVAHMYPWELDRFEQEETFAHAYSIAVGCPEGESVPLYRAPPKRDEPPCRLQHKQWYAALEALRARLAQPEPEPVAIVQQETFGKGQVLWVKPASQVPDGTQLYTAPPKQDVSETDFGKTEPLTLLQSLPCCGEYQICGRPCTPRGKWIAHQEARREWQGLTDDEVINSYPYSVTRDKGCFHAGANWAGVKLREKNK